MSDKLSNTEKKFKEQHQKLLEKWNKDYLNGSLKKGLINPSKKATNKKNINIKNRNCIIDEEKNPCIIERCVICKIYKPVTPLYFNIESNSKINIIEQKSGFEQVSNRPTGGCRECYKKIYKDKKTVDKYRKDLLKPYSNLSYDWYINKYNEQGGRCCITNVPLKEESQVDWRVSIQNNNNKLKDHYTENCSLIAFELNVQQQNAIPDLYECWKNEVFPSMLKELKNPTDTLEHIKNLEKKWNNSVKENGVDIPCQILENGKKKANPEYSRLCQLYHLPRILSDLCGRYMNADKRSKRDTNNIKSLSPEILYNKLVKQKFKCYYSGIPLSFDRDYWNYFSLERIKNDINHTDENTVFICRIFNTAGGLNSKKLLYCLLNQNFIELSEGDKKIIKKLLSESKKKIFITDD